ncbi:hypothetical protein HGA64_02990, partial [Candidatus Falkowbacteria bacterium]|nr:hypothetical protein [Candidatus Falkowbacteria bacterium]
MDLLKRKKLHVNLVVIIAFLMFAFSFVAKVHAADTLVGFTDDELATNKADLQKEINTLQAKKTEIKAANPTSIQVADPNTAIANIDGSISNLKAMIKEIEVAQKARKDANKNWFTDWSATNFWKNTVIAGGSKALGSAMTSAMNTIAYDTATWLGSGGKGQKPLFYTEGWGAYLTNVADNAAGTFIESFGKTGLSGASGAAYKFNLCNPNFALKMKLSLGMSQSFRPKAPACTFTKMMDNWEKELTSDNFLQHFQGMFDPTDNDFGIAFTFQTGILETIQKDVDKNTFTRQEGGGFISGAVNAISSGVDGLKNNVPVLSEVNRKNVLNAGIQAEGITKYTGYALVDAANVFINQLAITAFNNLMSKLGGTNYSSPYANWDSLISNFSSSQSSAGINATKDQLRKIVEPRFNVRGDYNILSELASCPNPTKAGPTNCVIDDKFRQAITDKKTVADAVKQGYLNGNSVFAFSAKDLEPSYTGGLPYRSMLILRKFRIIPVGWEIAGQYVRDNVNTIKSVTLNDMIACFDPTDEYQGYSQTWCQGLVDPNWLLKAPSNYCRREGPGPENLSDDPANITRNDKYCGDEQSCIKEKADGSCEYYGYCTGERRKWKFGSESCDPTFNTCQTFKKSNDETVSYLQNTLDYNGCTVDNAGCADYCTSFNFATGKYTCTATSTGDKVFLDRDVQTCEQKSEGCSAMIRTKDGQGANLLLNSSFEEDLAIGGWAGWGSTSSDAYSGLGSLSLNAAVLAKTITVGPGIAYVGGEYNIEGEGYTVSFYAKNCVAGSYFSILDGVSSSSVAVTVPATEWQRFEVSHIFMSTGNTFNIEFGNAGAGCLIDSIKVEQGTKATEYSDYGQSGLIYEKIAPSYLGCDGSADPAECSDFARSCKYEEVGCELYTPTNGEAPVPGKVKPADYCVAECVGFDTYLQSETEFDSMDPDYFIPKTAKACSAEMNGCDQFTNLDKLGSGAEATEYYSYLRQCITSGGSQFYTWEGSNETGFQLKVINLKLDDDTDDVALDLDGDPATAAVMDYTLDPAITGDRADEVLKCNERIYQLKQTDVGYNPDCREYYNSSGQKSYHLYTQTISEDSNCHPYRRTENNTLFNIGTQAACEAESAYPAPGPYVDIHFDAGNNECIKCLNGGVWNDQQNSCVYMAIPGEGRRCSAAANGCREYTGNTGQTVKVVKSFDFEDGTIQGWSATTPTAPVLSTESINMGGHSLFVKTTAAAQRFEVDVFNSVQTGKSYALTLIGKTRNPVSL